MIFTKILLISALAVAGAGIWGVVRGTDDVVEYKFPETKYGAFLAAQHAIHVNDFNSAMMFSTSLQDLDMPIVSGVKTMAC